MEECPLCSFGDSVRPGTISPVKCVASVRYSGPIPLVWLELNGKESTLYIASAKLVEYDGKTLTIYRPGYRPPTAEERFVLNTWKTTEDKYIQENPFGDCFGKRKAYFASSTCPWMDGINKIRGMRYCPEKDKILDFSVRGEMILRYEVYLDP